MIKKLISSMLLFCMVLSFGCNQAQPIAAEPDNPPAATLIHTAPPTPTPSPTPSPSPTPTITPTPTPTPDITLGMTYDEFVTLYKYMSLEDVMPPSLYEIDKARFPNFYGGEAKNGVSVEAIINNRDKKIGVFTLIDEGHTEALYELACNAFLIFNGELNIDKMEGLHDMFAYVYSNYLGDHNPQISNNVKRYSNELHIGNLYYRYEISCVVDMEKITHNVFDIKPFPAKVT